MDPFVFFVSLLHHSVVIPGHFVNFVAAVNFLFIMIVTLPIDLLGACSESVFNIVLASSL